MPIIVDVISNSGLDWAAVAAAGATAVAAVGGIWGTARQARRAREAAAADLTKNLAAAQENLRLNNAAEDERVRIAEEGRSYDAAQQRITELYSKAVEQLGHVKAPVRLGGFYALERLAQGNADQRQTVIDVVCAYLRMPFSSDADTGKTLSNNEDRQELQVRLAAQSLLIRHLEIPMVPRENGIEYSQPTRPPSSYWENITINLAGARLFDVDFTLCVLEQADFTNAHFMGETRFWRTTFETICHFDNAQFFGRASFARAMFETDASFENTDFFQEAEFVLSWFGRNGLFERARFSKDAIFDQAQFDISAVFNEAQFEAAAQFNKVKFTGPNLLDTAKFKGSKPDFSGSTVTEPERDQGWPSEWHIEPSPEKHKPARLVRRPD